ncbi:MAG TPA: hypothetical protein VFN51_03040 [Candidatus Saccharimonadales bacterium]|nr:hypothetical protein [Candidatus Saccharimonadales bacterium]
MSNYEDSSPEQVAASLPYDVILRLGFLASVPDEQARVNLGVQPFGTAALLEAYGLVNYADHESSSLKLARNPGDESAATMIRVTEFGREVMAICHDKLPTDDSRDIFLHNMLDITEDRRRIINSALTDQPHPATILVHHLDRLNHPKKPTN